MMKRRIATAIALAALVPALALAQAMEPQEYEGIRYVTGGVGASEQEALKEMADRYNLGMTFAADTGQYLSRVKVEVKDRSDKVVLSTMTDGPVLLAELPKGRYTVEATFDGKAQRREVSVAEKAHRKIVMHWPVPGLSAQPGK